MALGLNPKKPGGPDDPGRVPPTGDGQTHREPQPRQGPQSESSRPAPTAPITPPPARAPEPVAPPPAPTVPARETTLVKESKPPEPAPIVAPNITERESVATALRPEIQETAGAPAASVRGRRMTIGAVVFIYVLSALTVWGVVGALAQRYIFPPWDVTQVRTFTLATETKELLKRINQPLKITSIFARGGGVRQRVLEEIEEIAALFKIQSTQIYYQRIDPDRDPAGAFELISRAKLPMEEEKYKNSVIIELNGHFTLIPFDKIATVAPATVGRIRYIEEKAFHGEFAFASAILNLIEDQQPNVDFVMGHGELDINDFQNQGLKYAALALQEEKIRVRQLYLLETNKVPDDTNAVVIIGPVEPFSPPEITALEKFLERGGGLFLALQPGRYHGLDSLIMKYGIQAQRDLVVDPSQRRAGSSLTDVLVKKYGDHPTVSPLATSTVEIANASSVVRTPDNVNLNANLRRTELLWSSDRAWGETDVSNRKPTFSVEQGDHGGPRCFAIAAEIPPDMNDPKAAARGGVRLVVAGTRDTFMNYYFKRTPANGDLFQNIVNWLAKRDRLSTARPRTPDMRPFSVTESQAEMLAWISYGGIPSLFAVIGILIWWRRRA